MAPVQIDPLIERARTGCLRIMGKQPGCGFAVAPQWLLTCAHVVGRNAPEGSRIALHPWSGAAREGILYPLPAGSDLALLRDPAATDPAGTLDGDLRLGDPLAGIGFPVTGGQVELDQFTAEYEGETHSRDAATGAELRLLKLKVG
jgi:hypothetical protein